MNAKRYLKNLEVFKCLKNGNVTRDLLKEYAGWGGLREAVYTPSIYRELRQFLTMDEINSLKKTLTSAYYTPKEIIAFMYDWLRDYGFTGGSILEPAVGNGAFIEYMPEELRANSKITAVEIDKVSSKIVTALYPDVDLTNSGFEEFNNDYKYDLIIGNPPYGSNKLNDPKHQDLNGHCIHHYFAAKCMRLLNKGGVLAMVLPSYFLDNMTKHVRNIIKSEGGDLLAAYRLPDDLFSDAKVTVDVVFLVKGCTGNDWTNVRKIKVDGMYMPINEYYYKNQWCIFGKLAVVDMYERKGLTCKRTSDTFSKLQFANVKSTSVCKPNTNIQNINNRINQLQREIDSLKQAVCGLV